jgi:hypothetical protein
MADADGTAAAHNASFAGAIDAKLPPHAGDETLRSLPAGACGRRVTESRVTS